MDYIQIGKELRLQGYRLTEARIQVCRVLCNSSTFVGAYEIYNVLKEQGTKVGVASIYRVLDLLCRLEFVEREEFGAGGEKFRLNREQDHTHQLVCSGCGAAKEFANCSIHHLAQSLENTSGFKIHNHWLRFFGLCPNCQGSKSEQ